MAVFIHSQAVGIEFAEIGLGAGDMLRHLQIVQDDGNEMVRNNLYLLLKKLGNPPNLEFLYKIIEEMSCGKSSGERDKETALSFEKKTGSEYLEIKLIIILVGTQNSSIDLPIASLR